MSPPGPGRRTSRPRGVARGLLLASAVLLAAGCRTTGDDGTGARYAAATAAQPAMERLQESTGVTIYTSFKTYCLDELTRPLEMRRNLERDGAVRRTEKIIADSVGDNGLIWEITTPTSHWVVQKTYAKATLCYAAGAGGRDRAESAAKLLHWRHTVEVGEATRTETRTVRNYLVGYLEPHSLRQRWALVFLMHDTSTEQGFFALFALPEGKLDPGTLPKFGLRDLPRH